MTKRFWSTEEKARIVLEGLTTSIPMSELCRKHNVNHAQYYNWRSQFLEAGKHGLVRGATSTEEASYVVGATIDVNGGYLMT